MDHPLSKSVRHFLRNQILRDDFLIIDESSFNNREQIHSHGKGNGNGNGTIPFEAKLARLQNLCAENNFLSAPGISSGSQRLLRHYEQTQSIPTPLEFVQCFMPHAVVNTNKKHFGRQQDHAQLLKKVSTATNGCWLVKGADSRHDRSDNHWVIAYKGQRNAQSFRFIQQGDWLDKTFLSWLVESAEYKSGYRISCHHNEAELRIVCLPNAIHSLLIDNDAALLAA